MQNDCFPDTPADWDKSPISAIADINPRYPVKKGDELPFIEMAAVAEQFGGIQRIDRRKLEGSGLARFRVGDTLFAKITPCPENGKIAFVHELPAQYGIGSTEFIVLSPKENCDPRYLFHLVCAHAVRGRAASRMEGSTGRQRVPEDVFRKRLLIPIPGPDEQSGIARILDAVDLAIGRTRNAVNKSHQLRSSLLADLLANGLSDNGHIRDRRKSPRAFANTPLGMLPASWTLSAVDKEFTIQTGFTLNENRRPRYRKRRYLRVANVQRDALSLDDILELEAHDKEFAPRSLKIDDLLIVEGHADRMQIGRCARVTKEAEGLTFQNHLYRLRTNGAVLPDFACLWLNSEYAKRYWNARCATSSGLNTINQRTLKRLLIPVPGDKEQGAISDIIQSQRKFLQTLIEKQRRLSVLKESLLVDLISGAIRVNTNHLQAVGAP